ncbi:MAG: (Fe-S)-binding protein [Deltaproteobacteria bacterium]|nr:(Fe-S)-binding protein [Deltaproteobacteria bacterium]
MIGQGIKLEDANKIDLTLWSIIFFILLALPISSAHATDYYALRLPGSDCTLCHIDPKNGSLNEEGGLFLARGYRYPFTLKGTFFYFLATLTFSVILFGLSRRYRLWHIGKSGAPWDHWSARWRGFFLNVLGHRTILRRFFPGVSHLLLFSSLLILSLLVMMILIQEHLCFPLGGTRFIGAGTYPYFRLALDLSGAVGWLGTLLFIYRRYIQRPEELDHQRTDALSLLLLFFVFLTGFLATGIRNHIHQSPWSSWSPVATGIASTFTLLIKGEGNLNTWSSLFWWVHITLSVAFFCYLPFSRLFHLFSSSLSILLRNLEAKGALKKIDIEASEPFGVTSLKEFTWKELLELDACTRCGRCQENCPTHLTEKHLNPKRVIQNLKRHMEDPHGREEGPNLIGSIVTEDEVWECTTCRNCLEHCPVFIEPMTKLMEFRRSLVLNQGKVPREPYFAFRNIERKGNPWGFDPTKRMWWIKEMGVKELVPGEKADFLFWVGCYGSYDDRNIVVATSLVRILNQVGLNFGVLGSSEWCCGIDLRRMGSEYLFQVNVEKNIDQLRRLKFEKIITTCPHCFNTLKNEYPQFGFDLEVVHYTALLEELIQQNRIEFQPKGREVKITYHDSCYLGRYNDGYEPPRRILSAMEDLFLLEMEKNREKGFCCGGGGCHMWMEERAGKRINEMRIRQALETGAEVLATACPLCLTQLDSAVKVLNMDDRIRVRDILELIGERI